MSAQTLQAVAPAPFVVPGWAEPLEAVEAEEADETVVFDFDTENTSGSVDSVDSVDSGGSTKPVSGSAVDPVRYETRAARRRSGASAHSASIVNTASTVDTVELPPFEVLVSGSQSPQVLPVLTARELTQPRRKDWARRVARGFGWVFMMGTGGLARRRCHGSTTKAWSFDRSRTAMPRW
jgi:hypothetical protein